MLRKFKIIQVKLLATVEAQGREDSIELTQRHAAL